MKRFGLILKIRFGNAVRSVRGTVKAKDFPAAMRIGADQTSYWIADDVPNLGPVLRTSLSVRELKPKPAKRTARKR